MKMNSFEAQIVNIGDDHDICNSEGIEAREIS